MLILEDSIVTDSPFIIMDEIGILLFAEYPSTVVFINEENQPVIREWIDCSVDGKVDRYYYYKTNANNLNLLIGGVISHRKLVEVAEGGMYYFEDISSDGTIVNKALISGFLPDKYYPGKVFVDINDIVDLNEISTSFNLIRLDDDKLFDDIVRELATKEGAETYTMHIQEGRGVGFGKIKTDLLGKSLVNFDALYQEAALDDLLGYDRGDTTKKKREELEPYTSTEVYHNLAASYSVLIKPKHTLLYDDNEGELITSTSKVANKVFKFINECLSSEVLNKQIAQYSPKFIQTFRVFIQYLKEENITVGFSWYNPDTLIMHSEQINYEKASLMIGNIEKLTVEREVPLTKFGKFDLLNCTTGHFGFNAEGNESITGYFGEAIKEGIRLVNFVDTYTVSIIQTTTLVAGKSEPKIENVLTAYYRDTR